MEATSTDTETKTCRDCGADTACEIPEDLAGTFRDLLRRIPVRCDPCQEKIDREEAEREGAERAAVEAREHLQRINRSGIPVGRRGLTWDGLDVDDLNRAAIASAREWADGGFRGLVLSGNVGVGKTHIALAACNAMLRRRNVRWFAAARFMVQARAGFKNEARDEITDVLLRPEIALVLDDIDKVNATDFTKEILFQAIDDRLMNETPILITTNKGYVEIERTFGEPIASRIYTCRAHRIEGQDRRRGKRPA